MDVIVKIIAECKSKGIVKAVPEDIAADWVAREFAELVIEDEEAERLEAEQAAADKAEKKQPKK